MREGERVGGMLVISQELEEEEETRDLREKDQLRSKRYEAFLLVSFSCFFFFVVI